MISRNMSNCNESRKLGVAGAFLAGLVSLRRDFDLNSMKKKPYCMTPTPYS